MVPLVASASAGNALTGRGGVPGGHERMKPRASVFTSLGLSGVSKGEGNGFWFRAARMYALCRDSMLKIDPAAVRYVSLMMSAAAPR